MSKPFELTLFRHGIAVDRDDPACPPDRDRPLTPRGVQRTRAAAQGLHRLGLNPNRTFTSPLVRARETAEILCEVLSLPSTRPVITESLEPAADPRAVFEKLGDSPGSVICVGHAPHLDDLLAYALGGVDIPGLNLKKAGAASVWIEGNASRLLWFLNPRALRRIGQGDQSE